MTFIAESGGTKEKMKRIIITIAIGIMACCSIPIQTQADNFDCKKYIAIFARGSGQNLDDSDYQSFKSTLNSKFNDINFYELGSSYQDNYKYPAFSASNFSTLAGAYFSAGKSYEFGNSVSQGINELQSYINNKSRSCPDTKYVLGGYSQGAMVISSAIKNLEIIDRMFQIARFTMGYLVGESHIVMIHTRINLALGAILQISCVVHILTLITCLLDTPAIHQTTNTV